MISETGNKHPKHRILLNLPNWVLTTLIRQIHRFKVIALIAVLILSTLSLTPSAAAATTDILVGSEQGELVFEPSTITIKSGETIKWVNNITANSPCNVVFDYAEFNEYPTAADEDKVGYDSNLFNYLSHKNLLKAPEETFTKIFNVPSGEYTYACIPHRDAGMVGKVIVE